MYIYNIKSVERPVVTQQQVIPHSAGNVQVTDCWETPASEEQAQSTSTEMLQRTRLAAPLTHQVKERSVLLRQEGTEDKHYRAVDGKQGEKR